MKSREADLVEQLNLFGVPVEDVADFDDDRGQNTQQRNKKRAYLRELLQVMERIDEQNGGYGHAQDFERPKQFVHFDPYSETAGGLGMASEVDSQYAALKYDDQAKLRASIIIDLYKKEMTDFERAALTPEAQVLYQQCEDLMSYLQTVKIIDAPILLKIYNLYRCKI